MNMENYQYTTHEGSEQPQKRPSFLTVLCVLTFIGSGFSLLSQLGSYAFYELIPEMFVQVGDMLNNEQMSKVYSDAAEMFATTPRYYFLVLALVYVLSITGATFMLMLRKIGFHIYTVSQLLFLSLPMLIIQAEFNIINFLMSVMFVFFYSKFLKIMS
ncbi:MAG: hypothetical protein GX330_04920 [Bacteroidales bacterium]|nr:hypothetical protein [Bacteroidales bacterium]